MSVARRLGVDESKERFEAKSKKIAKAKPAEMSQMSRNLIAAVAFAMLGPATADCQVDTSSYPRQGPGGGSLLDNAQRWQALELQRQAIEMQRLQLQQQRQRMQPPQLTPAEMQRQLEFERQEAEAFRKRHPR